MQFNKNYLDTNPSVVIPFFNRSKFLQRLLGSLANQTFPAKIIYIIDNGSSAIEIEKCENIIREFPSLDIRLISTLKKGNANIARSLGLNISDTKYVAFLDSDDWWEPMHLEVAIRTLEKSKKTAYFSGAKIHRRKVIELIPEKLNDEDDIFEYIFLKENTATTPTFVVNKNLLPKDETFWDLNLRRHQDYDFFFNIHLKTNGWCNSQIALINVDWDSGGTKRKAHFRSMVRFIKKWESMMSKSAACNYYERNLVTLYRFRAPSLYIKYYKLKLYELNSNSFLIFLNIFKISLLCKLKNKTEDFLDSANLNGLFNKSIDTLGQAKAYLFKNK